MCTFKDALRKFDNGGISFQNTNIETYDLSVICYASTCQGSKELQFSIWLIYFEKL